MFSSEYRTAEMTNLSSGEIFRVHEQPIFITNDHNIIPLPIFEIEFGNGFVSCDFTWMAM
jgi:hypothetical protein